MGENDNNKKRISSTLKNSKKGKINKTLIPYEELPFGELYYDLLDYH
uniref:Uncharacterized protein n=1 Tax=Meloidogyne enterolobii TaxID=390850 RepID=A0A6V7WN42_MELEN|nr:unnamed protein product [Meloidogyne enterolobii]